MKKKFKTGVFLQLILAALLVLTLFLAPFNAPSAVSAAGVIPSPVSPTGTISDTTPTFKWTNVEGATNYEVRVYKSSGTSNPIQTITAAAANCGTTYCTKTTLNSLAIGAYKWKVRAKIAGNWQQTFSNYKNFTLSAPGFDSQFTSNASGWSTVSGTWTLYNGFYNTSGIAGKSSSVKYKDNYSSLNYTVVARRASSVSYNRFANHIMIRGGTDPLSTSKDWNTGYIFGWTNNQMFSVFKSVNGIEDPICLSPNPNPDYGCWNDAEGVYGINPEGWNTIQVIAIGSSLSLYINSGLWWSGNDPTLSSGKVGFGMYRDASETTSKLSVDSAVLNFNTGPAPTSREVTPAAFGSAPADWEDVFLAPVK